MAEKKSSADDASFKLAESTRDTSRHEGFVAGLFEGETRFPSLFPYPEELEENRDELQPTFDALKKLLEDKVDPETTDATGEIPEDAIIDLKELGGFGIKIPSELGGLGLAQSDYKHLAVLVGGWDGSFTALFSAHNSIGASQPLLQFGSEEQKKRFLPDVAAGAISGFSLTEDEAGSDLTRIRVVAVRVRDEAGRVVGWRISGRKRYTTNGPKNDKEFLAKYLIVIARIVDDPQELEGSNAPIAVGAFVVDANSPGVRVACRRGFMGLRAIYNGDVEFENVWVSAENRIRKPNEKGEIVENDGISIALATLAIGRLTLPAACAGALKQTLSMSRWWAGKRVQWFGKPIGDKELIQEKLANMAADLFTLEAMVNIACKHVDERRDVRIESAACKVLGSSWLWRHLDEAVQIRAGRGYETASSLAKHGDVPLPLERMLRDARINRIFEGVNEVMRLWIAREGLDPFARRGMKADKGGIFAKIAAAPWFLRCLIGLNGRFSPTPTVPGKLLKHLAYIRRRARHLERVCAAASLLYRKKLINEQLLTALFADIAMELFAMSAACSRAAALVQHPDGAELVDTADYFCRMARERIPSRWKVWMQVFFGKRGKRVRAIARHLFAGKLARLEKGIIPLTKKYGVE